MTQFTATVVEPKVLQKKAQSGRRCILDSRSAFREKNDVSEN